MPTLLDLNSARMTQTGADDRLPTVSVDAEPSTIDLNVPSIAIDFPAFNDGRGLSLAVLLRERHGFQGELRACGDIIPDLLHYLQRCRFDTAVVPERFSAAEIEATFRPHSDYYQASAGQPEPAFRRTRRGA